MFKKYLLEKSQISYQNQEKPMKRRVGSRINQLLKKISHNVKKYLQWQFVSLISF